jgi:hypothetical protein
MTPQTKTVLAALKSSGLLLTQDKQLANVVTLVTGESLRSSWWSHPQGQVIFAVLTELDDHKDVLFTKLVQRKVTLVHRKLWPAFLAVATCGEPWQRQGLSAAAKKLLAQIEASSEAMQAAGAAVKELERGLLAHTEQVHTDSGRHETALDSWSSWQRRVGIETLTSVSVAKERLVQAVQALGARPSSLPWH